MWSVLEAKVAFAEAFERSTNRVRSETSYPAERDGSRLPLSETEAFAGGLVHPPPEIVPRLDGASAIDEGAGEALERIATRPGMPMPFEVVMARAGLLSFAGDIADAARLADDGLAAAAPGSAGWLLPIDPLLAVHRAPDVWAAVLARLGQRAGLAAGR